VTGNSEHQGTYTSAAGVTKVEKVGYYPQLTVLGWEPGRIRMDISLKVSWLEKDEEDRTVLQVSTLRAREWLVVGKKVKYILTRDTGGKPESWVEFTIR
jgi:hypothetical protein